MPKMPQIKKFPAKTQCGKHKRTLKIRFKKAQPNCWINQIWSTLKIKIKSKTLKTRGRLSLILSMGHRSSKVLLWKKFLLSSHWGTRPESLQNKGWPFSKNRYRRWKISRTFFLLNEDKLIEICSLSKTRSICLASETTFPLNLILSSLFQLQSFQTSNHFYKIKKTSKLFLKTFGSLWLKKKGKSLWRRQWELSIHSKTSILF